MEQPRPAPDPMGKPPPIKAMAASTTDTLVSIRDMRKSFPLSLGWLERLRGVPHPEIVALDGVDLDVFARTTTAVVGESGSGKSTLARCILRLVEPNAGKVIFDGIDVGSTDATTMRRLRRRMQIVFQDPYSSLNPAMTVSQIIGEVLAFHRAGGSRRERHERIFELLHEVGLDPSHASRYPHEFSGGQRQRVGIARALALRPEFIILDEPVSALDVSVRAQIMSLLEDLQQEHGLTYLFIAHDLSVVHHIAARVAVMYLGRIVEEAPVDELYTNPHHPYTKALLAAIPRPEPSRRSRRGIIAGEASASLAGHGGCPFGARCPQAMKRCEETPPWIEVTPGHFSRCWLDVGGAKQMPLPFRASDGPPAIRRTL